MIDPPFKRAKLMEGLSDGISCIRMLKPHDADATAETHHLCGENERLDTWSQLGMRGLQISSPESFNDDAAYVLSSYLKPADSCGMSHPVQGSLAIKSEPVESMSGPRLVRSDTENTEVPR